MFGNRLMASRKGLLHGAHLIEIEGLMHWEEPVIDVPSRLAAEAVDHTSELISFLHHQQLPLLLHYDLSGFLFAVLAYVLLLQLVFVFSLAFLSSQHLLELLLSSNLFLGPGILGPLKVSYTVSLHAEVLLQLHLFDLVSPQFVIFLLELQLEFPEFSFDLLLAIL